MLPPPLTYLVSRIFAIGLLLATSAAVDRLNAADDQPLHALVIGNGQYGPLKPLPTAEGDARSVARVLENKGFDTVLGEDVSNGEMRALIEQFGSKLGAETTAVIFYAGYSLTWQDRTYLLPIGGRIRSPFDLVAQAIPLDQILSQLEWGTVRLAIIILETGYPTALSELEGLASWPRTSDLPDNVVLIAPEASSTPMQQGVGANSFIGRAFAASFTQTDLPVSDYVAGMTQSVERMSGGRYALEITSTVDDPENTYLVPSEKPDEEIPATTSRAEPEEAESEAVPVADEPSLDETAAPEAPAIAPEILDADFSADQKIAIQTALVESGFDAGTADGIFGARTRRAIANFQSSRGDTATGYLTQDQLEDLLGN